MEQSTSTDKMFWTLNKKHTFLESIVIVSDHILLTTIFDASKINQNFVYLYGNNTAIFFQEDNCENWHALRIIKYMMEDAVTYDLQIIEK